MEHKNRHCYVCANNFTTTHDLVLREIFDYILVNLRGKGWELLHFKIPLLPSYNRNKF